MEPLTERKTIKDDVNHFLIRWFDFPFDYWWRKKYNIPFGSQQHRAMSPIDMYIEYREELLLKEMSEQREREEEERENRTLGIDLNRGMKLTQEEIDEDFENLDLGQFDKKK